MLTVNETAWPPRCGPKAARCCRRACRTPAETGAAAKLTEHLNGAALQYPPLVIDAAGNVTVAWEDTGTPNASVLLVAGYRNGAWSTSTADPQDGTWPALAVNAAGAMALVWQGFAANIGSQIQSSFIRRKP